MKLGVNVIALDPIQLYNYESPSMNNTNIEAAQTYEAKVTEVPLNARFLEFCVWTVFLAKIICRGEYCLAV
jgi:hypothetical protein